MASSKGRGKFSETSKSFLSYTKARDYFIQCVNGANRTDASLILNNMCNFARIQPKLKNVVNAMLEFDPTLSNILFLDSAYLHIFLSIVDDDKLYQLVKTISTAKMQVLSLHLPQDFILDWVKITSKVDMATDHNLSLIQRAIDLDMIGRHKLFCTKLEHSSLFMCADRNAAWSLIAFLTSKFKTESSEYLTENVCDATKHIIKDILERELDLGKFFPTDVDTKN
jgi:ethanolamine utilization protein EutP (predicted NTPase)